MFILYCRFCDFRILLQHNCLGLEEGTDSLYQNVSNQPPIYAA
jgi:hypothetical protein